MKATIKIELRKDYATKEGKQMVCLRYITLLTVVLLLSLFPLSFR